MSFDDKPEFFRREERCNGGCKTHVFYYDSGILHCKNGHDQGVSSELLVMLLKNI